METISQEAGRLFSRPEVERALLGNFLQNPELLGLAAELRPEDFSLSSHACIFSQMRTMSEMNQEIDLVTLASHLECRGKLEPVGGYGYVASLLDGLVIRPNVEAYVEIVKEVALRRQLAHGLEIAANRAADPSVAGEELVISLEKLGAAYKGRVAAERKLRFRTAAELASETSKEVKWVACPFVAAGGITLAIGKVKAAGKTTLFTYLAKSILDGAPFLGMGTTKGPVLYLSEQSDATIKVALQRAGLLHRTDLRVLTWAEASWLLWPELVRLALKKCQEVGAVMLVVDTIGQFTGLAGDTENNAGDALQAMQSLQQAAAEGLGILVGQHERKSGGEIEDSGRGSSAFAGAADIVLNIRRLTGNGSPTLRTVRSLSRFDETPPELTIELTAEGYVIRDTRLIASERAEASILTVAAATESEAMTLGDLCVAAGAKRTAGQDAVKKLVAEGRLSQIGKGCRGDPHRYYSSKTHPAGTTPCKAAEANGEGAKHVELASRPSQ